MPGLHGEWKWRRADEFSSTGQIRLQEPAHVGPASWNRSRSPQRCGAGSTGKAQSAKAFSMVLMLFLLSHRHAAPLKSPATRSTFSSSITARIVRISFFSCATFLGVNVTDVQRQNRDCFFGPLRVVGEKRHVIARPVKPSLNLLPSPYEAIRTWYREGK